MNDEAREVLVAAALRGHRQIRDYLHNPRGQGECALGVLHLTMHTTRQEAVDCVTCSCGCGLDVWPPVCRERTLSRFAVTLGERDEIATRNDHGADFLTIARKVGHGDDV